jgi:hypothetical protein
MTKIRVTMSEDFYDWLDQCPCQWVRDKISENSTTICFTDKEDNK